MKDIHKSIRERDREIMRLKNFFDDMLIILGIVMLLAWTSVVTML